MINKKLPKILFTLALMTAMIVPLTSCKGTGGPTGNATGGAASQQEVKPAKMGTETHVSMIKKLTDFPETLSFDEFKYRTSKSFNHTAKAIESLKLKDKNIKFSAQVEQDIKSIHSSVTKIKEAKTPEEAVMNEKPAFNATASALKNIIAENKLNVPNSKEKLSNIEKMSNNLDAKNHRKQTKETFKEIGTLITDVNKAAKTK